MVFIFLPKITIGFSGSLGMNQTLLRACGSLKTGGARYPSLLPLGTRKGLQDLLSASVGLEKRVLGARVH